MKKAIIMVGGVLLTGISLFGWGTSEQLLGEEYFYLPQYEAVDVGYPGGTTIYKSDHQNVFTTVLVQGGVVEVQKDNHFILAARNRKGNLVQANPSRAPLQKSCCSTTS